MAEIGYVHLDGWHDGMMMTLGGGMERIAPGIRKLYMYIDS